jgi:hypothetical protein
LISEGLTDKEVAVQLRIGAHGVRRHIENLFRRFGLHSRFGLAIHYLKLRGGGNPASGKNATKTRRVNCAKVMP